MINVHKKNRPFVTLNIKIERASQDNIQVNK